MGKKIPTGLVSKSLIEEVGTELGLTDSEERLCEQRS